MGILDDAKDFIKDNQDKVEEVVEKAGDLIDEKTGGKLAAQVDQAQQIAKDKLSGE